MSRFIGKENCRVSVVVTCYNHGHFLREAIESIRSQTLPASEIILVDDGSIDDTQKIAGSYSNVVYIRQSNSGLASARNTGLKASTGEFIVFLDADDRLTPPALRTGLQCLLDHPGSALAFGGYRTVSAAGVVVREFQPPRFVTYDSLLTGNPIGMNAAVMYRHSALEHIQGFDRTLPSCEDYDAYLRLAQEYEFCRNDSIVAEYRRHATNMSNDTPRMLQGALYALRKQQDFLKFGRGSLAAYGHGQHLWQQYYCHVALKQIGRDIHCGYYRNAVQGSAAMFKLAPLTFAGAFGREALRELRKLCAASISALSSGASKQ